MAEDQPPSKFRDFFIVDTQNTLQSASYRHSRGDFDGAEQYLHLAKNKIDNCLEQLKQDRQESQDIEGGRDDYQ